MASLLSWGGIKKKLDTVYHGINPLDNGQGWTSRAPAPRPMPQAPSFQGAKYGVLANPQAQRQFIQQNQPSKLGASDILGAVFNASKGLGQGIVQAPIRATTAVSATPIGKFLPGGRPQDLIEGMANKVDPRLREEFRNQAYKDLLNQSGIGLNDTKFDIGKKFISNAAQTAALAAPVGIGKAGGAAAERAFGAVLPKVPAFVARAAGTAATEAPIGAAYNVANAISNGNLTRQNASQIALQGAQMGALFGGGASLVGTGAKQFKGKPLSPENLQKRNTAVRGYNESIAKGNMANAEMYSREIQALDDLTLSPVMKKIPTVSADNTPTVSPKGVPVKKARGFAGNLSRALPDNATAKEVVEAVPGYKPITNKRTLSKAANAISENPQAEFARIITKPQLTSASDVATGNLLLREAIEKGDTETAIQLGTKMGIDGTKLGQAIQAYSTFKKTTPEGIVTYASKKAGAKGKQLSPELAGQLIDKAKIVAQMPEGIAKARATRELLTQANSVGRDWRNTLSEVLSTPRAAMATADLSAPLRQGAVLGTRYPKQFGKAFVDSVKYFANPKIYEKEMYDISRRPRYSQMKRDKLAISAVEELTGTEEQFLPSLLESKIAKKLGVGKLVAASNRGYSGFLTKFRADVYDSILDGYQKAGVNVSPKTTASLAKFINSASGRGSGTLLNKHGGLLSQALFSPRLWKSRIDTLNPVYYARLDPAARKLALQSAGTFAATATTILSLAKLSGADVEDDPRSADFGKIKVGDTRYDILGGHQQNIRLASQLISGQKINSVTGEVQTLGPDRGFGKPSRLDLAYQFVENKENPVVGFATKALRGTDQVGNKVNLGTEAAKLGIPLTLQSTYETAKNTGSLPKGIAMNIPGTFGVGVQTYGNEKAPPKKPSTGKVSAATDNASKYSLQQRDDGKYEVVIGDKTQTRDNLKDARALIAGDALKKSGKSYKVIGDTVYRKSSNGKISSTPKIKFDYQLGTATLAKQKKAGDVQGWVKTANSQIENINRQLQDPTIDPLEALTLQNRQQTLLDNIAKYKGYGGFTKGKSGRGRSSSKGASALASTFKLSSKAVSLPKGVKVAKTKTFKAPTTRKLAVSKIPSNYSRKRLA